RLGREWHYQMRLPIKSNDRDTALYIADQHFKNGIKVPVVRKMRCPSTTGLNHDCQRERLRIAVFLQSEMLQNAVICEHKVIRFQVEDWISVFRAHKHRDHN